MICSDEIPKEEIINEIEKQVLIENKKFEDELESIKAE